MGLSTVLKRVLSSPSRLGATLAAELWKAIDTQPGRNVVVKSGDYTVLSGDNGTTFVVTGAANLTLPTAAAGLAYWFLNSADVAMGILAPGSNDSIITDGDTGADSVTFSTTSHKVGAFALAFAVSTDGGSTYKWAVIAVGANAATIA